MADAGTVRPAVVDADPGVGHRSPPTNDAASPFRWMLPVPTTLQVPNPVRETLALTAGPLTLARVWPRTPDHLGVEYHATDGTRIAGQWFADEGRLAGVAGDTALASAAPSAVVPGMGLLLQAGGADRRLVGLASLVSRPATSLLMHRPERSATLRETARGQTSYLKVVRPKLVATYVAAGRAAERLDGTAVATPRLIGVDPASGLIASAAIDGAPLHDHAGRLRLEPRIMQRVGSALRAVHEHPAPAGARLHGVEQELSRLNGWLAHVLAFQPGLYGDVSRAATDVSAALATTSTPSALVHGDFSDKQVIVAGDGRIGIVDWDTLAIGEPALDLASMVVSIEVRAMQGLASARDADDAATAFLDGYGAPRELRRRIAPYADAARLRLACLNAFRPAWAGDLPVRLVGRIGRPVA